MERLFNTHNIRKQISLDGIWDFQIIEKPVLPGEYSDKMTVPACWENNIKYCQYSGYAAYRKTINIDKESNIRLLFKGVSHTATVYLDGIQIGYHHNAYTPFNITVPKVSKGKHTIEVIVDNSFSERTALHISNDYFTYGGITRSVFLEEVSDCYIERFEFKPLFDNGRWMAEIKAYIRTFTDAEIKGKVSVKCAEKEVCTEFAARPGEEVCNTAVMGFDDVVPWSCEKPELYFAECKLTIDDNPIDDLIDRVGFRVVEKNETRILINGNPVFIKGVNRHEEHGSCGCSIPLSLMYTDIALIKDLGANAIRTCHYPNDELFLDLCDENGILVWEESHARNTHRQEIILTELFKEQSLAVMREMLDYHYNHPSIIIWGCLNEDASDNPDAREVYKLHMDMLSEDKTRLCTFASNKISDDICLDMAEVCSFNIYPYWYCGTTVGYITRILDSMKRMNSEHKPVIISEYGAGAIYGFRDNMKVKWSEEYQAEVMERETKELMANEKVAGIFVWMFCDCRVKGEAYDLNRPKSRNNKGLLDEYRRPKLAYDVVKKIFNNG